jgi:dihydropteroate synthase
MTEETTAMHDPTGTPPWLGHAQPQLMGVLNVTPDSFSDGGRWVTVDQAVAQAERMVLEGAAFVDIGGESTRPGSVEVSLQQELDRVIPVLEALSQRLDVVLSIDTSKPEVMREAVAAGAGFINDVYGLRRPGALEAAAQLGVPVCLMHMRGEPGSMQDQPAYADVVTEVEQFLLARAKAAEQAGIAAGHIVLDPGFGFGKSLQHNLDLLRATDRLAGHGYPLLAGLSRKSMLQPITGRAVDERLAGSLALAMLAAQGGAQIIRVHDVAETTDVLKVLQAFCPIVRPAG